MADEFNNYLRFRAFPALLVSGVIDRSLALAKSVKLWIGILAVVVLLLGGLSGLFLAQGAATAAYWTLVGLAVLTTYWALIALYAWSEVGWVRRLNALLIVSGGFGIIIAMVKAAGGDYLANSLLMIYLAVVGFMVGINLLRIVLFPSHPIFGVARTMIEEALRMRVALVIIVFYLVMLAVLPAALGSEDRVTYMVQRMLNYSFFLVMLLLGTLTVLLGAYSVSRELASRQVQMTLTKPVARWQYLFGKWLGIVLLNAVLVTVGGVAIYGFTTTIAQTPGLNEYDDYQVEREIMTARVGLSSLPVGDDWEAYVTEFVERPLGKRQTNPQVFGQPGDPLGVMTQDTLQDVMSEAVTDFYTVRPGTGQAKDYVFTGLGDVAASFERARQESVDYLRAQAGISQEEAEDIADFISQREAAPPNEALDKITQEQFGEVSRMLEPYVIQLVLHPGTRPEPADDNVEFYMRINDNYWPPAQTSDARLRQRLPINTPNEVPIPASLIDADGTLKITIEVPPNKLDGTEQQYIQFNPKGNEIELFYRVGSFEGNLCKAMFVVWLKLCFLAILGLVLGALLSFPVAALLGLIVFVAASVSGYINEALDSYGSVANAPGAWEVFTGTLGKFFSHLGNGEIYDAFKMLLRLIGETFMLIIPSFSQFATTELLDSGRVIPGELITWAVLKIGLLWTGVVGLVGMFLFSRKEIARVIV